MKKNKTKYLYLLILLLQAIGVLVLIPQAIPSWEMGIIIFVSALYGVNLVIAGFILHRTQKKLSIKQTTKKSWLLTIGLGLIITGWLFYSFLCCSMGFGQGLFGGALEKEIHYPAYGKTLYIYNSSWLDPETTIKMREGWLPIMKDKKHWYCAPNNIKIEKKGDYIQLKEGQDSIQINLKTGALIE